MVCLMATNRVRIVTYVEPELAGLLADTASALGTTRSNMLADLLASAAPVLDVLRQAATTIESAPEKQREAFAALADAIRPAVAGAGDLADRLDPPPSNRGVRK